MNEVETQPIGELKISRSEFIEMSLNDFKKLFPLSSANVAIALPVVTRKSRCFNLLDGQDVDKSILVGMYEIVHLIMQYLKSNNLPTEVLLSFSKKSLLYDWYIDCEVFAIHKGETDES
jgi:hypothetical protein